MIRILRLQPIAIDQVQRIVGHVPIPVGAVADRVYRGEASLPGVVVPEAVVHQAGHRVPWLAVVEMAGCGNAPAQHLPEGVVGVRDHGTP